MQLSHYAIKLLPSRPDFAFTMTAEERQIMQEHVAYWMPHLQTGKMVVFGPILDPAGPYGFGIVATDSEEELKQLLAADPASRINRYEYYPMMATTSDMVAPVIEE
jgi:uncharacterized protein YciI